MAVHSCSTALSCLLEGRGQATLKSAFYTYHSKEGSRNRMQVMRLMKKYFYRLSHLAGLECHSFIIVLLVYLSHNLVTEASQRMSNKGLRGMVQCKAVAMEHTDLSLAPQYACKKLGVVTSDCNLRSGEAGKAYSYRSVNLTEISYLQV